MGLRLVWLAVLVAVAIVSGATTYGALAARFPRATGTPVPSIAASPSGTVTPTASPTPSPSPTPTPDATVDVTKTAVPAEFHYLVLGTGNAFRVVLLDLGARTSTDVASVRLATAPSTAAQPSLSISASADGRVVLLAVRIPERPATLFVLRPTTGESQPVLQGEIVSAIVSRDGSTFAIGRNDQDPSLTGLWVGSLGDRPPSPHRLIADDPLFAGSPPVPLAFSFDGGQLAFGLPLGDPGYQAGLVPVSTPELRVERSASGTIRVVGGEVSLLNGAATAEFISPTQLFAWNSRTAFGGVTSTFAYDVATKQLATLYRPATEDVQIAAAAWRPGKDEYATIEQPMCCGANPARTAWIRARDGSARKIGDAGPFAGDLWWSRDGTQLFERQGADDATGVIVDILTGRGVVVFCLRGGGPPPNPCT